MLHFAPQSLKPAFWPLRPDLTAGRRLWPNIRHLWPMWHGVDSVYDIAQGRLYSTTAGSDTTTRAGSAVSGLSTSAVANPLDDDIANWRFTIFFHADTLAALGGTMFIYAGSFGFRASVQSWTPTTGRVRVFNHWGGGGNNLFFTRADNQHIVVTCDGSTEKLFINGSLITSISAGAKEVANAANISFAAHAAPMTYLGIMAGGLPDDEAAALSRDVFSPIRADPAKVIPLIVGDAGGAPATDVLPPGLHQIAQGNVGLSRAAHTIEEGFVT